VAIRPRPRIYCDITKLVEQITEGDENETDGLYQKMDELAKKLGPEYAALMDGLQDIDPESKVGQEIESVLVGLREAMYKVTNSDADFFVEFFADKPDPSLL
jgi:hypothetical protein